MQRPLPFDGQLVDETFMQEVESDAVDAILNRTIDFTQQAGRITGLAVTCTLANTLTIQAGVAYDAAGERIEVPTNTNVSFLGQPAGSYVMLALTTTDGTPKAHPVTGVPANTRRVSGWTIMYGLVENPAYVTLAQITSIDGFFIATLDLTVRKNWRPKLRDGQITDDRFLSTGTVMTHVGTQGTGVLSDTNPHALSLDDIGFSTDKSPVYHQQKSHVSGFEPPARAASLLVTTGDVNATILYSAKAAGVEGNRITIAHVASAPNQVLAVAVSSLAVTVTLETDDLGQIVSTASEVVAEIADSVDVSRVISAALEGDGSGTVEELEVTALSGGLDEIDDTDYGKLLVQSGSPDLVRIGAPAVGDSLLIDGSRISSSFTPTQFTFEDAEKYSALYAFWVRPDGVVRRELRARMVDVQYVTGVQIVDMDDSQQEGTFGLVFSAGAEPSLSWAGGPGVHLDLPARSFDGNQQYRLYSGLAGRPSILVQVTFDQLPIRSFVDLYEVKQLSKRSVDVDLGQVWWQGEDSERLGYGVYNDSGQAYDRRPFGTTSDDNLHPETLVRLSRLQSETRSNGWISGGQVAAAGGLVVLVNGGTAWVDGSRFEIGPSRLSVPVSTTVWLVVDALGTIRVTNFDPSATIVDGRYARVARIDTDAVQVTKVYDERSLLGEVDEHRLLGAHLLHSKTVQQQPRISVPQGGDGVIGSASSPRTLLLEAQGPPDLYATRVYLNEYDFASLSPSVSGIEIVHNAKWYPEYRGQTNIWLADNPKFDSVMFGFRTDGFYVRHKRKDQRLFQLPAWKDLALSGTWDGLPWYFDVENFRLLMRTDLLTQQNGDVKGRQNPEIGMPILNRLLPKGFVKAWAHINVTSSVSTMLNSFNVHSFYGSPPADEIWIKLVSDFRTIQMTRLPGTSSGGNLVDGIALACSISINSPNSDIYDHRALLTKVGSDFVVKIKFSATVGSFSTATRISVVVLGAQ